MATGEETQFQIVGRDMQTESLRALVRDLVEVVDDLVSWWELDDIGTFERHMRAIMPRYEAALATARRMGFVK